MEEKAVSEQAVTETSRLKHLDQWVTRFSNFAANTDENLNYLNSILGPLKSNPHSFLRLDNDALEAILACSESSQPSDQITQQIIFKIDQKVFIESIDIYEKECENSSLLKIEAKETKINRGF